LVTRPSLQEIERIFRRTIRKAVNLAEKVEENLPVILLACKNY